MDEEDLLDSHPDLVDPQWREHARTDARRGAKQDRKRLRKQRKRTRPRRPGGRWRVLAVLVAILAVTTTAIVLVGRRPAEDAAPTTDPTRVPQFTHVDLARPYANTPADAWPKGIDGITSPPAVAVGAFPAGQVTDAYAKVKRAVAAARLDPAVLYQHDLKTFAALFAPDQRAQLTPVLTAKPSKDNGGASSYLTEIADGYHLLDAGPRTFGTLTARAGGKPGELAVDAKYVVAYAFDNVHPEGLTRPAEIVTFLRVDETYVVRGGPGFAEGSHGLWLDGGHSAYSAVGCAAAKDGFLAPGYANPPSGPSTGGDQRAPGYYDPKYPLPAADGCPA